MSLRRLIVQSILWRGVYFVSVLILNIMIARYYEASYSGLLYFVVNSYALVVIVGSLSLESGLSYYLASGRVQANEIIIFSVFWSIGVTAIIGTFLYGLIYKGVLSGLYEQYYGISVLFIGGNILSSFFGALFYARKSFFLPNLLMTSVNLFLIILLPFTNHFISLEHYLNFYFGGFMFQGILLTLAFFFIFGWKRKLVFPSGAKVVGIFKYAFQALAANVLFFLLYRIDYWLVERYCSASELGNYIQVSKLVQLFLVIPGMIAGAVFPASALGNEMDIKSRLLLIIRVYTSFCLVLCLIIVMLGQSFFPFLFGSSFDSMYRLFLLIIPGILSLSMVTILASYFAGRNQVGINVAFCLAGLFILIPVDLLVIPRWGADAAALTSSFAYLGALGILVYFFLKNTSASIKDMIFIKRMDMVKALQLLKKEWRKY